MAIGLSLYLGLQSIYIVGFGFPTIGCPMHGSPNTLLFPQTPLSFYLTKLLPFFLRVIALLSMFSLELSTPFSHFLLLFIG